MKPTTFLVARRDDPLATRDDGEVFGTNHVTDELNVADGVALSGTWRGQSQPGQEDE